VNINAELKAIVLEGSIYHNFPVISKNKVVKCLEIDRESYNLRKISCFGIG